MTDQELNALAEIALTNRARLDVLERAIAIFMAHTNRPLAEIIEDQFRGFIERGITSNDTGEADKLARADAAAVRFSDIVAQALAKQRN